MAALSAGTRQVLVVAATTAVAGIVVGVLLQTGLGPEDLEPHPHARPAAISFLTLVVAGVVLWVLGLSLPITATYLVAVPTVIPALVALGVPPPAAHMFVFYYAVLSEVSPPVALSPFAAAAITGGNPYRTMMLTWKYALPCFLVPFMFTQPDGLALLWRDVPVTQAAVASISAIVGIVAVVAGVGGYLLRPTTWPERALLVGAGLLLLAPGTLQDAIGLAAFAVALGLQLARRGRERIGAAAPSLEHSLQVVGQDVEGPDLLRDVRAAVTLVAQLDVLEVLALFAPELEQPVAEDLRLLDGAARVVHAVDHQQLRAQLVRELDRAAIAPQRAVLLGIAHLLAEVVLEVLHALRRRACAGR